MWRSAPSGEDPEGGARGAVCIKDDAVGVEEDERIRQLRRKLLAGDAGNGRAGIGDRGTPRFVLDGARRKDGGGRDGKERDCECRKRSPENSEKDDRGTDGDEGIARSGEPIRHPRRNAPPRARATVSGAAIRDIRWP